MVSSASINHHLDVPVVLMVYRRPELTSRVLRQISLAKPKRLIVIADGPSSRRSDDVEQVEKTRRLFDQVEWECEVVKIFSESNMGLRARVLSGLDEVFRNEERAIILEDDCEPHRAFFDFCGALLSRFKSEPSIGIVSGNNFAPRQDSLESYYFSLNSNIWGWATWRDTWFDFREWASDVQFDNNLRVAALRAIPDFSTRNFYKRLLSERENLDSWALDFSVYCYLTKKLSIVPHQNLVSNIGFGAESTHTKFESWIDSVPSGELRFPLRHPKEIKPNRSEMSREVRVKLWRGVSFVALHPVESLKRVMRYIGYGRQGRLRASE